MADRPLGNGLAIAAANARRDLHCVLARNTAVVRLSPSVARLTGHAPAALVGRPLLLLVHPHDAAVFFDELRLAAARPGCVFRFHARIRTAHAAPSHAAFELRGHFHPDPAPGGGSGGFFTLTARPAFLP